MTTNPSAPSLAHRTLSNIRSGAAPSPSGPSSPHTPLRTVHSSFGSPSSLRADDDIIVIEFGAKRIRVGFAGDPAPRGYVSFGPGEQRRVGDFRAWQADYQDDWRKRSTGKEWGQDHELWKLDVRELDLALIGDKVERGLREVFTKYLLVDSRPRKMVVVASSSIPTPLLSTILDSLFNHFFPPTVSLLSAPISTAVAAGVRSALVVDIGWHETLATSVYEYREVRCDRTVRGGRMLVNQMHRLLARLLAGAQGETHGSDPEDTHQDIISFDECDDITSRLTWCHPPRHGSSSPTKPDEALPTVQEQDESEPHDPVSSSDGPETVSVPLTTASPPTFLDISYTQLTEPCENTFFDSQYSHASFDDHELPLHLLIYRSLLQLPLDVRAVCMSRIIFTGGSSKVLGLRKRVMDEVSRLVQERGWDPVVGKGVEQLKQNPKLNKRGSRKARRDGPIENDLPADPAGESQDGVWHDAANAAPETDPVEEQLRKGSDAKPKVQGEIRAIDSVGAWSGASLLTQLKIPAVATIDRELWQQQGVSGAVKASEVDLKAQQRQSMGPGGLMRNAVAGSNWTLGIWGSV